MKKIYLLAALLCGGFAMTSCSEDPEFDNRWCVTFEGPEMTALIDSVQYDGELLYGPNAKDYKWSVQGMGLSGGMTCQWGGTNGFSEGGSVISNYIDADIQGHATYNYQLAVPKSNGSKNFVVVYAPATVNFEKEVTIHSMDITNTTYGLGVAKYGDATAKALTQEGDYFTLTITADNGSAVSFDLARDGRFLEGWQTVNLSALGKVKSLTFTMDSSDKSDWGGINTPSYFAFDNVVFTF